MVNQWELARNLTTKIENDFFSTNLVVRLACWLTIQGSPGKVLRRIAQKVSLLTSYMYEYVSLDTEIINLLLHCDSVPLKILFFHLAY